MLTKQIPCQQCGTVTPPHEVVSYASGDCLYRQLCSACANSDLAACGGVSGFHQVRFTLVRITDARGVEREFHFRQRLFGQPAFEAFEWVCGSAGGCEFQMIADVDADPWMLLAGLIERIRRTLAVTHLRREESGQRINDRTVRGRLDSNPSTWQPLPVLVIDEREVIWKALGCMLMSFEGWQFKLSWSTGARLPDGHRQRRGSGPRGLGAIAAFLRRRTLPAARLALAVDTTPTCWPYDFAGKLATRPIGTVFWKMPY